MADSDRAQIRIYIEPEAKKIVATFAERYGQTEQKVASDIYGWFARQPKSIQKWLVGLLEDDEANDAIREYATALLESIDAPPSRKKTGSIAKGDHLKRVP